MIYPSDFASGAKMMRKILLLGNTTAGLHIRMGNTMAGKYYDGNDIHIHEHNYSKPFATPV